jgi:large subunit ribosomal protein L25
LEIIDLESRPRTGRGKSHARKIRQEGWIPAVYYGHNKKTMSLKVSAKDFAAIVRTKKTSHLINLKNADDNFEATTVIKEIQRHVLKENIFFHIDFQHIAMDKKITVKCPIRLKGNAIGVVEESGVLSNPTKSITIECLPSDIPEFVNIDISDLHLGNSITVKDLNVPNVEIKDSPQETIVSIMYPQVSSESKAEAEKDDSQKNEAQKEETEKK